MGTEKNERLIDINDGDEDDTMYGNNTYVYIYIYLYNTRMDELRVINLRAI